VEYQKKSYRVDTGGLRGELPLTDFQKQQIEEYISSLSLDNLKDLEIIRWVNDRQLNTAYSPGFDLLQIGSDVMPANRADRQGILSANTRITWKGSIAHELV
jgi:hypothetical protein